MGRAYAFDHGQRQRYCGPRSETDKILSNCLILAKLHARVAGPIHY